MCYVWVHLWPIGLAFNASLEKLASWISCEQICGQVSMVYVCVDLV